jgi:hypothetical protein
MQHGNSRLYIWRAGRKAQRTANTPCLQTEKKAIL